MSRRTLTVILTAVLAALTIASSTFAQEPPRTPQGPPPTDPVEHAALIEAADRFLEGLDPAQLREDPELAREAATLRKLLDAQRHRPTFDQGQHTAIKTHFDRIGGLVARHPVAFEQFGIRVEDAMGTPRCHDSGSSACSAGPWLSTRSPNFVNIRGDVIWRGSSTAPAGRQLTASFVATQDDTNVAIYFSAEAYVEDDLPGTNRRMFVQAVVDGKPVDPNDVVFAVTEYPGVRTFVFSTNVSAGIHTVEMRWRVDERATGYIRDASLMVRMGRDVPSAKGTLNVQTPSSGPNQETTSSAWTDVPGMWGFIYVGLNHDLTATMSAETYVTNGKRIGIRALVDGQPMSPSDMIFAKGGSPQSRAVTFGANGLSVGWHFVKFQWQVESGGTAGMGDRTIVLASAPASTHPFVTVPSGQSVSTATSGLEPMPGMSAKFTIPPKGNGEVAVQLSAEVGTLNGAAAQAVLVVDGFFLTDDVVQLTDGAMGAQVKTYTFDAKGLAPGLHEVEIWWSSGAAGAAYVGDRTLSVQSEVGFTPDLAEAPQFGGGHVNWAGDYIPHIEPMIGTRNVLAILWDPGLCGDLGDIIVGPAPTPDPDCKTKDHLPKGKVEAALFGQGGTPGGLVTFEPNNVRSYFNAQSGGRFTIAKGPGPGVAGWYDAQFGSGLYYNHPGGCTYGFDNGGDLLIAEAVSLSNAHIDYSQFDLNGDGKVDEQELAIIVVVPRKNGDGSSLARLYGATCTDDNPNFSAPMVLDGVEMPQYVAKVNTSLDEAIEAFQFTTFAHELMHVWMLADDQYMPNLDWATEQDDMNLLANNRTTTTHLDPWHKLMLGWVTPVVVDQDSVLKIMPVAKSNEVYILPRYNNPFGEEFYILEFRKEGMGHPYFDEAISDSGIAVWHIVTDPTQIVNSPIGVTQAFWDTLNVDAGKPGSVGQMGRKGIRLIKPFDDIVNGTAVFNNANQKLWDFGKYDLESHACFQIIPNDQSFQNKLAWADCTASGYSLKFLSWAIEPMEVQVKVD